MASILSPLAFCARHGRLLLVIGLAAGIAFPGAAAVMKPWLPEMVAGLLFVAALRIGPRAAIGAVRDLPGTISLALIYQLALPLALVTAGAAFGWRAEPLFLALALMASASSISGAPNLAIMTGNDPAPALRMLIIGTAILPVTVLPVFWLLPELGGSSEVLAAAGRLTAVIGLAGGAAFVLRGLVIRNPSPEAIRALDGFSALLMAIVVVALMAAVGPAISTDPLGFAFWLTAAFSANFGLQVLAAFLLARTRLQNQRAALAIVAGNRNIALFLAALPASVTDPLLVFIGCYQIPMYLTPILLGWFYRSRGDEVLEK